MEVSPTFWRGRRVLVTGHTGFKGSWLVFWLNRLGAEVCGYSLPAPTEPSHWGLLKLDLRSELADIRDASTLRRVLAEHRPEIVFHLAAQPLVRASYTDPVETFSTNVMGTLQVFEAARATPSVRAIVNVTSDKCYENREWDRGYRETDAMGGFDPYSASKGCAELLTASYRNSFFHAEAYGRTHQTLLASCRSGNVIGGGDWARDRLVPDTMRATGAGQRVTIRNPDSTRPWQHVLEPLSGYLLLGQRLLEGRAEMAAGWNFGPADGQDVPVRRVLQSMKQCWPAIQENPPEEREAPHEARLLKLDCTKARSELGWEPVWDYETTILRTVQWYREYFERGAIRTESDLADYTRAM